VFFVDGVHTGVVSSAAAQPDHLLTTGEVAELIGSSRQHVVDLCERGALSCESVGTHRRIRASDALAFQRIGVGEGLSKEARRSLWLHTAAAGKVAAAPVRSIELARRNLDKLLTAHPRGEAARQLRQWERLLGGPVDDVLDVLTSRSARAVELRQNSPFAGLLTDRERRLVLDASASARQRR
jgi:excisionase family DNA binding protein